MASVFQETPTATKMADEFRKLLNQYRCEKGNSYTHTSIGNPRISLHVPPEEMTRFYDGYRRAMVKGSPLHLTEKPMDPSPMRADLDFRFIMPPADPATASSSTRTPLQRMYGKKDVQRIVKAYFEVMAAYLDAPPEAWVAYIMEKSNPSEYRGKVKDGIHIIWPHLIVSHRLQHLIRKKLLDMANVIFSGMPLCNTYEDIIDQAIIDKNNWQMYGSRKPDSEAYRVTYTVSYDPETCEIHELPAPTAEQELKFVELFSMRFKQELVSTIFSDKVAEVEDYARLVLPAMDEKKTNKLHGQIFGKSVNHTKNMVNEDELILARQLVLECLSPRRAESYELWIKLGWALRNIDYRLLDAWVEFSRCSSKYIEGECQTLWDKMRIDMLGMGTLRWWARQDNPMKYAEIMDQNVIALVDMCIGSEGAHFDVARVVQSLYKDRYRYTTSDVWYAYRDDKHRWVKTKEGLQLRIILSNDVCSKFMERAVYWSSEATRMPESREILEDKAKKLTAIALKLKTAGYKDSVMKECKCLFTDERFEELLDSNAHLIGFDNGVYDLRLHEFRDGLPDDYISFSTGKHYIPFDPDGLEAKELNGYLSQVFTNSDVCRFMKDVLACVIDGGIRQEKFYVFTGSGCHAKNTMIMLQDGSTKPVQDVVLGDHLMGDDGTSRIVEKLFQGQDRLIHIIPTHHPEDSFVVNQCHKLSLKASEGPHITMKDTIYEVHWNEVIFSTPEDGTIVKPKFHLVKRMEDAQGMLHDLSKMPSVLKRGDVVDVQVKNYVHFQMFRCELMLFYRDGRETSFTWNDMGMGDYYGFRVDKNHRYVMGNEIITANSNSKSKLLELVQRAIGDYYCILPIALLTQKRAASNSAQSELERTKGRRFAVMQEPGENEKINIGLMKELSGGDRIMCRGLFKDPVEFKPQFKMIMTCNELPEVPSDDGGTWRRIRVVEFTSKFVENPNPNNPREFPLDMELAEKFDRWAEHFISMIIDHHKHMDPKSIHEPMEVRIATEGYKKNNDVIGQFVAERLVKDETCTERLSLNKIYSEFKIWAYQTTQKGKKIPDRNQFRAYLENVFGKYPSDSKGWKGIRNLGQAQDDDDDE
jgi:P4 family phage/plasmid primase-like protien